MQVVQESIAIQSRKMENVVCAPNHGPAHASSSGRVLGCTKGLAWLHCTGGDVLAAFEPMWLMWPSWMPALMSACHAVFVMSEGQIHNNQTRLEH